MGLNMPRLAECFVLLCCICAVASHNVTNLANGCVLKYEADKSDTFGLKYPYLNCTGLGKTSFDLSGMPTDIASLSLSKNELTTFNVSDLLIYGGLSGLYLSHNKIAAFQAYNNISLDTVKYLYISNNKLTEIPTEFLRSFPSLMSLDVSGNQITTIKDGDFQYIPELTMLAVGYNPVTTISPTALSHYSDTLFAISLQFCELTEVPSIFVNMTRLIYVSLTNNKISTVQRNAFFGAHNLRWVELASNRIVRLDRDAFAGTDKMHLVDLTDNLLTTLPPGLFEPLKDIHQLSVELYENPLRCDCRLRWLKLWMDELHYKDIRYKCEQPYRNHGKKSYEMELSDFTCNLKEQNWTDSCPKVDKPSKPTTKPPVKNGTAVESTLCPKECTCYNSKGVKYHDGTSVVSKGAQAGVKRLWWLGAVKYPHVDCTGARLSSLPDNIRPDVKALTLEDNNISILSMKKLKSFKGLQTLNLENSGLRTIIPDSTTILGNVTNLSLQRNGLSKITKQHLKSFPNLQILRLYDNKIKTIETNLFQFNRKLTRLYLGPNPVREFPAECLNGLKLQSLSLRNVSLRDIPRISSEELTYYDLSDNHISVIKNKTFDGIPNVFRLAIDNNFIITVESGAFVKNTALRYLDLSENRLNRLPEGVFDYMDKDRLKIELWVNRIYCDCRMRWFKQWIERLQMTSPMTEVRFMCTHPLRLHGRVSENLSPEDFTCQNADEKVAEDEDEEEINCDYCYYKRGRCFSSGQMGAAILLTMLFTILACLLIRCCCNRRKSGYARYKSQDDTTQLDLDM